MTQPLALIYYQKLLPGSTLANRLRDLNYRVHAVNSLGDFVTVAHSEGPMVLLLDLNGELDEAAAVIRSLRADTRTAHVPLLAFAEEDSRQTAARDAGATLATNDAAIISHLEQLLEQVLRVD